MPPRPRSGELLDIVYGVHAVHAIAERRPRDLRRLWYAKDALGDVQETLRIAAAQRVAYREADGEELAKVAGAVHHEGIVASVRARKPVEVEAFAAKLSEKRGFALALDRVTNPHNLGAIVRSAAFFGATGVLLGTGSGQARLGAAAIRIAQGGAEVVDVVETSSLAAALEALGRGGVHVLATDARADRALGQSRVPRPCIVVLGNEREGLGRDVRARCEAAVAIRGSGALDSLNVSVAAGVILAQLAAR